MRLRASGFLFLLEQGLCGVCLLSALSAALGLPHVNHGRRLIFALLYAGFALLSLSVPPLMQVVMILPLTGLLALVGRFPARRTLPFCLTLLMMQWGCAGLSALLPLPGAVQTALTCAMLLLLRRLTRLEHDKRRFVCVRIRCGKCVSDLTALVDSGNLLRDPLSGDPVFILPRKTFRRLTNLPEDGNLSPGMRLLCARTASGITLMIIRRPDGIFLLSGRKETALRGLIGCCLSGGGVHQPVMPESMVSANLS